ncbi:AMP-binding protein [Streptomyces sp. NPDC002573]|uniref:AMP-binding protein n=1 Tax=Streptomyces sp. NPDC002573 TaxID=3364651 RepID=UPI003678865E
MSISVTLASLKRLTGQVLFVSDWVTMNRKSEHAFQHSTLLHEDYLGFPSSNGDPWGEDLISGFLLLSMIISFHKKYLRIDLAGGYGLNYGVDRVRFVQPVLVGARVRLRAELLQLEEQGPGRFRCVTRNTLEVEGSDRPAMVADWIYLLILPQSGTAETPMSTPEAVDPSTPEVPQVERPVDFLQHWARITPDAELDVLGSARRTYAQGAQDVHNCAAALIQSGVRRGDRVAVLITPRPEFLTIFFALSEIGAVWVGLNPRHTVRELLHVVADSGASFLFTLTEHQGRSYRTTARVLSDRVPGMRRVVTIGDGKPAGLAQALTPDGAAEPAASPASLAAVPFETFLTEGAQAPAAELAEARLACRPDDVAALVYTSGTSGQPKGVMLSAEALTRGCLLQAAWSPTPQCRALAYLPVNHVGGIMDLGLLPVAQGGCLVYQEHFDPDATLDILQRERITLWGGIPTMFQLVAARPGFESADLGALQRIAWGGAPMPAELVARLRRTGAQLGMVYGLTEACVSLCNPDADADDETLATTIGRPDPRLDFRIADAEDRPVAVGQTGEIQTRHACLMQGYYGSPEATEAAFTADGFLHTGDLAIWLPDGNVRLIGRISEMYKSGGYSVYPREVEMALERHPAVAAAAVVAVPDPLYHEVGIAFVNPHPDWSVESHELEILCRQVLADYKCPKSFEIVAALPMLPNGKIDKLTLAAQARDLRLPGRD